MKLSTKELLEIAENSATDQEALFKIWQTSRSPKVRKAIASNPNASPTVLKEAARLYIEEVLTNPGFEMLRLFDDDPWIKRIGQIYENPSGYFGKSRYIAYRSQDMDTFGRAALVSPNCDAITLGNLACYVPTASIKRVLKNPEVKKRLRDILSDSYNNRVIVMDMEGLFKAWDSELITTLELASYIKQTGAISTMSCRKGIYMSTFRKLSKEYVESKTSDSFNAIMHILISSRGSCFNWINYEINDYHIPIIAYGIRLLKKVQKRHTDAYPTRSGAYAKSAMKELAGLFVALNWSRKPYENRPEGILEFYEVVKKYQLPFYEWGSSKKTWPALRLDSSLVEELDKLPIQVKEFYARSMSLGEWFYISKSEIKAKIVDEVNQWLYERGGVENLLYRSVSVKKIIALDSSVVIP